MGVMLPQASILTRLARLRQAWSVSLGVDGDHGDGVAGVRQQFIHDECGGTLRHGLLRKDASDLT